MQKGRLNEGLVGLDNILTAHCLRASDSGENGARWQPNKLCTLQQGCKHAIASTLCKAWQKKEVYMLGSHSYT